MNPDDGSGPRYVSAAEIAAVLDLDDLRALMHETMIAWSRGEIAQPPRRIMEVPPHDGFFGSMAAVGNDVVGAKLVAFYPGNPARGIPSHHALIALFDPADGRPLVLMEGGLITELRTAAVTAAFVDAVAPREPVTLALLGAGCQAHSHLDALRRVRDFADIRIWNRTPAQAEALAATVDARVTGCEDAVRDADVVVLTTAATEPVIDGRWLKPGARVASVGWSGADTGELDRVTMSATVVVDSREGALTESGNVRRYDAAIAGELGELLDGSLQIDPAATVVFESIGMAAQDLATAGRVWRLLAKRESAESV